MPPSIAPPSPEVLSQLLAENAHRYPEKGSVDPLDDGALRLPLLIGNPTGSIKPPLARAFPAWADFVALTMGAKKTGADTIGVEIARDCLIYPTPAILGGWEDEWPAILGSIGGLVLSKIGAHSAMVRKTSDAYLVGPGEGIPVTISTPTRAHYEALKSAVRREGADCLALLDELLAVCVKGRGFEELLVERPGLALPLYKEIMRRAGADADARLGEW